MDNFLVIFIKYFFPAIMVGIILYDFFTMTIPNGLNLLLFFGFCGLVLMVGLPYVDIGWHLLTAAIVLIIGFTAFAFNFFGGGDAKSIAAIAAWFGWQVDTLMFLLVMALLGGVFAVALLSLRKMNLGPMLPAKIRDTKWAMAILTPEMRMPYGVAIGASGLILYSPDKWLM